MDNEIEDDPMAMKEPDSFAKPNSIWMRGLWMIVFAILFSIAETVLAVTALVQWLWMLFSKDKNRFLVDFGRDLGRWTNSVARFQTGVTEDKPFPWRPWNG